MNLWLDDWFKQKNELTRQFGVGTQSLVELLTLSITDLWAMKGAFFNDYQRMIALSHQKLDRIQKIKK